MSSAIVFLVGIATMYDSSWHGQPLYCDTRDNDLVYNVEMVPWVAIPVEMYKEGWECGDIVYLSFDDIEQMFQYRAYDAGPLSDFYIQSYPELDIIADVPIYHWPFSDGRISAHASMFNHSLFARRAERSGEWVTQ